MKVYLIGETEYSYATSYISALQKLGYEVFFFPHKNFYRDCRYYQRKLYKLGLRRIRRRWEHQYQEQLLFYCQNIKPEDILWVNGDLELNLLRLIPACYKILTLWDSVQRYDWDILSTLPFYDKVFVFEFGDIEYIKSKCNIDVEYFPLGYDPQIYYPKTANRDIDVAFIGRPSDSRLRLLNKVADICKQNNKKMFVGGPWYESRYPWKTWQFKKKNLNLYGYIENRMMSAEEVADIYRRSKICLNMNTECHQSISPRTLEIMATNTFQLMNAGQQYHGVIKKDCGVIEYRDDSDCLEKLNYYWNHPKERLNIAEAGFKYNQRNSINNLCKMLMKKIGKSV